jgi:hypothetical protein
VWDIADGFAEAVLLLDKRASEEGDKSSAKPAKRAPARDNVADQRAV